MNKDDLLGEDWNKLIGSELDKPYMKELAVKLGWLRKNRPNTVVPARSDQVFRAFKETRLNEVRVVIIGQSPYPSLTHANGLAFSTDSKYITASLEKILYSIDRDVMFGADVFKYCYLDAINDNNYTLSHWIDEGILLLNANLTAEVNNPRAHEGRGWERFISFILSSLLDYTEGISYLAWGKQAKAVCDPILLSTRNNLYISCEHPASAVYGNRNWNNKKCFKRVNEYQEQMGQYIISW